MVSAPVIDILLELIAGISASICIIRDLCWFITMPPGVCAQIASWAFTTLCCLCIC